jgi:hypothetical protein
MSEEALRICAACYEVACATHDHVSEQKFQEKLDDAEMVPLAQAVHASACMLCGWLFGEKENVILMGIDPLGRVRDAMEEVLEQRRRKH